MTQREQGFRANGSHYGRPHGKDKRAERALRAKEREEARASRSSTQQLAALDRQLGEGEGARRERKRLEAA